MSSHLIKIYRISLRSSLLAANGDVCRGQSTWLRGRGVQGKQVNGNSLPMRYLPDASTRSSLHRTLYQIPFILPHPSSVPHLEESLSLVRCQSSILGLKVESLSRCFSQFRSYCRDSVYHYSEADSDGDDEPSVVGGRNLKLEVDLKEVEKVCKVIDETFAVDRNMEAVLDECVFNLSHDMVLAVLERFKHARKPAFRFFVWASERRDFAHDSRTYNVMMEILGKTRQFETMVSVLEEMGAKGLLTMETFTICIRAFAAGKERKKAVGMFDLMKTYNFKAHVETMNCLLDALSRAKLVKEAQALFEKLQCKFEPNMRTYTILLYGWCKVKNLMEAGRTWNDMVDNGFKPDLIAHNIMIEGLLRCHKRSDAIKLVELMKSKGPNPDVRSYTILIRYLCKHGNMNEAVDYFNDMVNSKCEPDAALYTCLMTGFANQKKMDVVHQLLSDMKEKGVSPDSRMYNALIKMTTSKHMPDDAVGIYKKMIQSQIQPSIHTYNMMMKSFFVVKDYDMGLEVWNEMKRKGCCPDENSYTVLIGGLMRQKRTDEACRYIEEMVDKGMKIPQLDLSKFKAGFSRTGGTYNPQELAEKMKLSGNVEAANLFARGLR